MNGRGGVYAGVIAVVIMFLSSVSSIVTADSNIRGYDRGVSWANVVPLKKITFVDFDENSYLDDYAYLACVPTAVFYDGNGRLFSYPLLYYQDPYPIKEDKERSLNARQGIDYFMEDWMSYCNGRLDGMTLINVDKDKVKQWPSRNVVEIKSDDPYEVAAKLALNDWSYSDKAVVAVIGGKDIENYSAKTEGTIKGSLSINKKIKFEHFEIPQTNKLNPQFKEFTVPQGYVGLGARVWYECFYFGIKQGMYNLINISIPPGDKDFQLYCEYDDNWMEVEAISAWNAKQGMDTDYTTTYVYKPGPWRISITDVPTKKIVGRYGGFAEILRNMIKGVIYKVDIEIYPGVEIPLNVSIPYYCRDAEFRVECTNSKANFDFLLIGPGGEKVAESTNGTIKVKKLGRCLPGEYYKIAIFSKEDISGTFDYSITYSWYQNKTKAEGDSFASATEGSVLASALNVPLLYVSYEKIPECTKNTIYKLGVKEIYLVNLGGHLKEQAENELNSLIKVKKNFREYADIYNYIRNITGTTNDIVFSTLDPWTSWHVAELKPYKEWKGALHIGPAAYIAAHHGTPVLIVDNHPELSSAVVWHTEFWSKYPDGYTEPTVSEMYLTGKRVYDFLNKYGFDGKGQESIITVAGQYDIGASWDRVFVGKAFTARITFSPVDSAYWAARVVFYPALIFVNPAMNPNGVVLENGSKSKRGPLGRLIIVRPSHKEIFKYPVLESFMPVYIYRFNERASKYWGFLYQCADGIIPGVTVSNNPIDDGVSLIHKGEAGSFWPDLSEPDYVPFYMSRCGYSNVFSTNFDITMENLNKGCLIWVVGTHGDSYNGGSFKFPDPDSVFFKEKNPWRGYEWFYGSTEEPDTMTTEIHGLIPMLLGNPNWNGIIRTALDFAPAKRPLLDLIGRIASLPIIRLFTPEWLQDTQDYYDGIVGSAFLSTLGTVERTGIEIDDSIRNIHSCGLITAACLPAYKYLHLAMVRHGSSFQVIDPWGTSWYSSFWEATIPRDIALGDTIGEAYAKGMAHVGILYLGGGGYNGEEPQWWWDKAENVCLFGDPDLRVFVPNTEYSDANYWTYKDVQPMRYDPSFSIDGHNPFGITSYPHEYQGLSMFQLILVAVSAIIIIFIVILIEHKRKS